ncbi:MAG: hypothetical protein HXS54_07175 [Theionarchaea archaeon]|nr:hypothetical protein [Theionarchaea archaeon]
MTDNGLTQKTTIQSRYSVRFLNHECVIDTSHDLLTEWNLYISPFFDISREMKESFISFRVEENPKYVQHILHHTCIGAESILHCDMAGKIVEEPDQTIVAVLGLQAVYRVQSSDTGIHIDYVCTRFSTLTSLDLLRLVRGLLIGLAETGGMKKAHMSVVAMVRHLDFHMLFLLDLVHSNAAKKYHSLTREGLLTKKLITGLKNLLIILIGLLLLLWSYHLSSMWI